MGLVFESPFLDIVLLILLAIIIRNKIAFRYWNERKVPLINEPKFLLGDAAITIFGQTCPGMFLKNTYNVAKSFGYKHYGFFLCSRPIYVAVDLKYVKSILQRDFNYFSERGFYYNEKDDPLSANLFAIGGTKWQMLRKKLSPAFTSGKLKLMFDDVLKCSSQMHVAVAKSCRTRQTINVKDIGECFTVDVIGSCAFGLECNSFTNPEAEFIQNGRKIFDCSISRLLKITFAFSYPTIARMLGIVLFDKDLSGFFRYIVKDTLAHRKRNNFVRNDFLQSLLNLQDVSQEEQNISFDEITAAVFLFFAAGFETSSITLTFALYELATNLQVQEKLREEVIQVFAVHEENITYEAIMKMQYLNQVIQETLRKYPPLPFITRVAVKDYRMPRADLTIERGMEVHIPILGIHHDPDYYPDPNRFDPERFSQENKQRQLPFTYMPFGEGPRFCIGLRFGLMQIKVGLVTLLRNFRFTLNGKTQVPLEMVPHSIMLTPKNRIILNIENAC